MKQTIRIFEQNYSLFEKKIHCNYENYKKNYFHTHESFCIYRGNFGLTNGDICLRSGADRYSIVADAENIGQFESW